MTDVLIEARDLRKHYAVSKGLVMKRRDAVVKAVDGVSFTLRKGETLGLAGESGCGKSTTAKLVLLLEPLTGGTLLFGGRDAADLTGSKLRAHRKTVQAVFQDPFSSLSPRMRIWEIIGEPVIVNEPLSRGEVRARVAELLAVVGLSPQALDLYPHEFSGGQRQRIAVARALSLNPGLVVLDEPVSALDVSIRAQIMNLLRDLQDRFGLSYLLIAHDLAVLKHMCDRVAIMYLGKIVETARSADLYRRPHHPYTEALLSAVLPVDPDAGQPDVSLEGEIPSPIAPPSGCRFHPRCPKAMAACRSIEPHFVEVEDGHCVACHLYGTT